MQEDKGFQQDLNSFITLIDIFYFKLTEKHETLFFRIVPIVSGM
jgi:hypothetical protein